MGRTARTEPQCLYKGALYLITHQSSTWCHRPKDDNINPPVTETSNRILSMSPNSNGTLTVWKNAWTPHMERWQEMQSPAFNRLTSNDPYMGRTSPLTSKRYILYICSTNISTEYFKHALYSPFFSLQNAVCFIMLTCLALVLFTFYIQGVLKLKK